MISDIKSLLDALKLPLNVTITIAVAASVLFAIDYWWAGALDLGPLNDFKRPVLLVIAVLFWSLVIVRVSGYCVASIQRTALRRKVLRRLDHLSAEEMRWVADCLRKESPTFYTDMFDPAVPMLCGKGLVWAPRGYQYAGNCSFSFYDFVWEVLLVRKDEFLAKEEEHKRAEAAKEEEAQRRRRRYWGHGNEPLRSEAALNPEKVSRKKSLLPVAIVGTGRTRDPRRDVRI